MIMKESASSLTEDDLQLIIRYARASLIRHPYVGSDRNMVALCLASRKLNVPVGFSGGDTWEKVDYWCRRLQYRIPSSEPEFLADYLDEARRDEFGYLKCNCDDYGKQS